MKPENTSDVGGAPGDPAGARGVDPKARGDGDRGKDRTKPGDPMAAGRPAASNENSDMSNGSGAD